MSLFKKIFLGTLIFTMACFTIAWALLAAGGGSTASTFTKFQSRLNQGRWIDERESVDLNGVDTITVNAASADIFIDKEGHASPENEALIAYSGLSQPGGKTLSVQREGSELKVSVNTGNTTAVSFNFDDGHDDDDDDDDDDEDAVQEPTSRKGLKIIVPPKFSGKVLRIEATSGDVTLKNMNVADLNIENVSGEIRLIDSGTRDAATLITKSGDIEAQRFNGKLRATSTSGDVEIKEPANGDLLAESTSGDISVTMPTAMGWKFSLSSVSGDLKNEFSDDVKANKKMQLNSTSGDIRVHR